MRRRGGQKPDSELLSDARDAADARVQPGTNDESSSEAFEQSPVRRHGGPPLGELLVKQGTLSDEDLTRALAEQGEKGKLLGEVLIDLGLLNERQLLDVLSQQLHMPIVDLRNAEPEHEAL